MSLRSKIILILCVVVALNAAADNVVQRFMVSESFVSLERVEAEKDLQRAVEIIQDEIRDLNEKGRRWGSWGPTYAYVQEPGAEYERDNLGPGALSNAGVDLLFLCDAERRVVWGRIEPDDARSDVRLRAFASDVLPPFPLFRAVEQARGAGRDVDADVVTSGLMQTERGPILISVSPVLPGAGGGPYRGAVILGRFLDQELVADIGRRVSVNLESWTLEGASAGTDALPVGQEFVDRVTSEAPAPVSDAVDEGTLHVYATFPDLRMMPALLLRASVPREIVAQGASSVNYALLSTLGTALVILFVLYRLLQRIVLRPLGRLTEHAVEIGHTDDTSSKVGMEGRRDEIGTLATEFDRMLEKLAEARAAHAETARLVGMSEIATGVLHNVGNVLNSVNVSCNLVSKQTEQLQVKDLEMLQQVLEEHADDLAAFVSEDPRGAHLVSFLGELTGALGQQRDSMLSELSNLKEGVEHIIELVRSQQSYAGKAGLYEEASLNEQVEAALKISHQALRGRDDVEVVREFEELPPIPLDKRKVTEILVNVIQNARHAMRDAREGKRLTLRVCESGGAARVEVADNGIGIAAENLARVFNHGFTTKEDGHGFGLHTAANAATEMKGRLWAESQGPGQGATFILELPMQVEAAEQAA